MASRRRRVDRVGGVPQGPAFFLARRAAVASAGRPPWRSSVVQALLRPGPLGFNRPGGLEPTSSPLADLRSRRDRIAPTSRRVSRMPLMRPVGVYGRLIPLGKPVLNSRSTPCSRRAKRREVMFARDVAGRKWGRGGPKMRNARFSISSQYRCA